MHYNIKIKEKKTNLVRSHLFSSEYFNKVYAICLLISRDPEYARDLRQEIYLKILRNTESLSKHENIEAWIWVTCKNLVIDRWRQNNKNWNNFLLKDFFSTYSIENSHLSEKKNCMTLINSLFQNIDAKNKKVIYMYYFEGKTQSEISEHLGISISAISNKIKKSLRKVYLLLN